jgi:hypothetical protein
MQEILSLPVTESLVVYCVSQLKYRKSAQLVPKTAASEVAQPVRQLPVPDLPQGVPEFLWGGLFYDLRLRCFVVIDLKMQKFTPEDAGKLNFYLSAVDSQLRHPDDQPAIGLLLCKTRDRVIAEYALRDVTKPIGVAEWQTKLVQSLPEPLRSNLPTIEQIEKEFGGGK